MKKKHSKPSHIKLIKKSPHISAIKATKEITDKSLENAYGWGSAKINQSYRTDISYFCNETIERGSPVELDMEEGKMISHYVPPIVRKYRGGIFVGIIAQDVVNIDLTQPHYPLVRNEIICGGKVTVVTEGDVVLPFSAKLGPLYLNKEGYTSNPTNEKIGVVTGRDEESCRVRLG